MREKFPSYFANTDDRRAKLWSECIFVFDTNVLTSVYKRSDEAKEALYKILTFLHDRIWIPHQVAAEFLEGRAKISHDQSKLYVESIASLKKVLSEFEEQNKHPFLDNELHGRFAEISAAVLEDLESKRDFHDRRSTNDDVMPKIADLFDGRVGDKFSESQLIELVKEGENRYANLIPPGYKDIDKYKSSVLFSEQCRKYGDFIFWRQILDHAASVRKPVILVTEEEKEDWWQKSGGKTIGPLPQLIEEFNEAVGEDFYLYSPYSFLNYANDYLHQDTSPAVIAEVKQAARETVSNSGLEFALDADGIGGVAPEEAGSLRSYHKKKFSNASDDYSVITDQIDLITDQIAGLEMAISSAERAIKDGSIAGRLKEIARSQVHINMIRRRRLLDDLDGLNRSLAVLRPDMHFFRDNPDYD